MSRLIWSHRLPDRPTSSNSSEQGNGRRAAMFLLALFAIVGWIYFFFFSGAFFIQRIIFSGTIQSDPLDLERTVYRAIDGRAMSWQPWSNRHLFFLDADALAKKLQEDLFLDSVVVKKEFPNILRLMLHERSNRFILHSQQQFVWVDVSGFILNDLSKQERIDLQKRFAGAASTPIDQTFIIQKDQDTDLLHGTRIPEFSLINHWLSVVSALNKNTIRYREYAPPYASSTIGVIKMVNGIDLYIDPEANIEDQLKTFLAYRAIRHHEPPAQEYIDLRIPNKMYIR